MMQPLNFDPSFPPLLNGRPVLEPHDPFAAAIAACQGAETEAGDFFWSCSTGEISFAVVLEPEVTRARAQEMLFVLMVACADALGAISPPELAITWNWPAEIYGNGGRLGSVRLAMSETEDAQGAPEWMVVGVSLALKPRDESEPGLNPNSTTLWDEGAVEMEAVPALESLSRHFLTWVHRWETDGFGPVHEAWLFRCDGYRKQVEGGESTGEFVGLDDCGNLLLKTGAGTKSMGVQAALASDTVMSPMSGTGAVAPSAT